MCGIAGVYTLRGDLEAPSLHALQVMGSALRHRGPDESGIYRDRRVGLAHTRLSILDLATGQQPLSNEDGTLWVIFNGEIYNYVELRRDLAACGHQFHSNSDTEVIVHAYEEWGNGAFGRFNGQWALALWDRRDQRLTLSRDPLGIQPLYLCEYRNRLYFASEVKAIFAGNPPIPRAFDPAGFHQTFTFWTAVAPQSVFLGVTELPPGHTRSYRAGRVDDHVHWRLRYPEQVGDAPAADEFTGSLADAAVAARDALEEATRLRMLCADVPVGVYVSGGLDSSVVASLAQRAIGERLQTFSVRFEDKEYDESQYQRMVVAALGSEHHEISISHRDIAESFPRVVEHTERPVLRTAAAPLFLLSRLVRESGIKVVLTGEGADEMFAGYDLFREARVRRFWARQPESRSRPRLLERLYPYLSRSPVSHVAIARQFFGRNLANWRQPGFSHDTRWHTTAMIKRLFSPEMFAAAAGSGRTDVVRDLLRTLPEEFARWSPLSQDQYLEIRTLLSGYLLSCQGDRMLMAHSVEGRFPFLDARVVELANSLPASYKLRGLREKHVLKEAARQLVPAAIINRSKQPYRAPDALSFVLPNPPEWIETVLSPRAVAEAGVFAPSAVTQLWSKLCRRQNAGQYSNVDNMAILAVLSTQLLHRELIARAPERQCARWPTTVVDAITGVIKRVRDFRKVS